MTAPAVETSDTATATAAVAVAAAADLLRANRLDDAERALSDIFEAWPGQPDALHFRGVLAHLRGDSGSALTLIRAAIERMPLEPGPWNNLGNVLRTMGQVDEALAAFTRSAELAQARGLVSQQGPQAGAEALDNLADLQREQDRERWLARSREVAAAAPGTHPRDEVIRALTMLDEPERAAALYREWLAEEPDNAVVQHQLAACLGERPARASDAYVEQVFDQFAAHFDSKLQSLDYRVPQLVVQAVAAAVGTPQARLDIVDVGCGTGLCAPLLRPWARRLAGCDLSVGMLREARQRGGYDVLHKAELTYYLRTQPQAFDVVVSADTFCYFGDLHEALTAAATALRTGGLLVFTVEALPDETREPVRLQANGRYVHGRDHVQQALESAGFDVMALQARPLRLEVGLPVAGWLVSARKAAPAAVVP